MHLTKFISPAVFATLLLCGCDRGRTYSTSSAFTERAKLTELTENSVKVSLSLEADSVGKPLIMQAA